MSLFVILVLLFTAVTGQTSNSFTVRVGGEVTLPCENVTRNQNKCDGTSWLVTHYIGASAEELVTLGISKTKSDRLSLTETCSLVIKKVTAEDVGRYSCRQFNTSGQQQGPDSLVHLSVVNIEEHLNISYCAVLIYGACGHTVKWLYEGNKNDVETSQSSCSATVTFKTTHLNKSNYYELLKCHVTDKKSGQVLLFPFSSQSSGSTSEERDTTLTKSKEGSEGGLLLPAWWWYIVVAVGSAALLIIFVAIIRWKRSKGNKTRIDGNTGQSFNPAVTQPGSETRQDLADPADGVSYASISYTKKTSSKSQVQGTDDGDGGDVVTYSTVKVSSAGSSDDPSNLYATVNKPKK